LIREKEKTMINVIIAGASGRMGQRVGYMVHEHSGLHYAAAYEASGSSAIGRDPGELAGWGRAGVSIAEGLESVIEQGDVIIDFTFHKATMEFARLAARYNKAMVIGTTGLTAEELEELAALSRNFPCVQAPNMAVGVNVLFKLAAKTAAILGNDYDIEIVEAHHNKKKDAPSGTALKLAEMAASGVKRDLAEVGVYERHGMIGERSKQEIGIQTIRAGDIVGEHTIYFAGPGERIEITHRAHSRDNFAKGAATAAAWVVGKKPGLYSMFDVLGLQDL
jgi:4-hydroxy-tetrahydrodipicolinate reductase